MSAPALPLVPRWAVVPAPDDAVVTRLVDDLRVPRALAVLLAQRGMTSGDAARAFLRAPLEALRPPAELAGVADAVPIVTDAVRQGTRILVHGDYDVDGQCGTALLTRALRAAGADVVPFVPHRMQHGYDFGAAGVARAAEVGAGLVITVDCGITAVEPVRAARAAGMRVVVTDHHLPGPVLPGADALVNPQLAPDRAGLTVLCGTGVAFKLVQALVPALGLPAALPLHLLDLVALATVADVVPLTGENRILVRHGLKLLQRPRWRGLRALIAAAGLADRDIRASHLGFVLGPRLNAAGRIGDAMLGVRLLLSDDDAEAAGIAADLESLNRQRQALDQAILEQAMQQVGDAPGAAIVLAGDDWHPGVVGIVASRVVEQFGRPVFLVAFEGETGRGSGRSISRFDLHGALGQCGDLLERFGGHRMAAGLTIRRDRLDAFRERFVAVASQVLAPEDLGPEQRVDLVLTLDEVTDELEALCRHLEPCGAGNAAPVLGVRNVRLLNPAQVGGGHLKATLQADGARLGVIGFGWFDRVPWLGRGGGMVDAAFRLERNEWNGTSSLQGRLVALGPAA